MLQNCLTLITALEWQVKIQDPRNQQVEPSLRPSRVEAPIPPHLLDGWDGLFGGEFFLLQLLKRIILNNFLQHCSINRA